MTYAWSSDYPHLIDHYELQAKINNNTWKTIISSVEDTTATFTTDNGDTVQIRVRAFDIIDRFSDWSEESNSDIADLDAPIIFPIN